MKCIEYDFTAYFVNKSLKRTNQEARPNTRFLEVQIDVFFKEKVYNYTQALTSANYASKCLFTTNLFSTVFGHKIKQNSNNMAN